jgi:hypothetical protein
MREKNQEGLISELSKKLEPLKKPSWFDIDAKKNQEGLISKLSKKLRVSQKPSWFKIKKPPLSMVFKTVFGGC